MIWSSLLLLVFVNIVQADHNQITSRILKALKRRNQGEEAMLGFPEDLQDLPEAEPVLPGHTLIQPEQGMLESSIKYPRDSVGNAVYGNLNQLSITYGKTPARILYTGFRKARSILDSTIRQAIRNIQMQNGYDEDMDVIVIESRTAYEKPKKKNMLFEVPAGEMVSDEENNASEILDDSSPESQEKDQRRKYGRFKYRNRNKLYPDSSDSEESSSVSSSTSESSDYDKNPGNPYTLHKGKYKQNYMWNHFMDGDHMNINPFGPTFDPPGPNGVDLFFGRKWWYFNQDDYKPLR